MSKIERLQPKTTWVRVTRKQQLEIVEYVDVELCRFPSEDTPPDDQVALDLVKAKDAAGEDVAWFTVSEKAAKYSRVEYDTETLPDGPPPPAPPPPQSL